VGDAPAPCVLALSSARALAADGDEIFWTSGRELWAKRAGSSARPLQPAWEGELGGLGVDATTVFFTSRDPTNPAWGYEVTDVFALARDAGQARHLNVERMRAALELALRPGDVYTLDIQSSAVTRFPKDGGAMEQIGCPLCDVPTPAVAFAVDASRAVVKTWGGVFSLALDGSTPKGVKLADATAQERGAIELDAAEVLWTDGLSRVLRVPLDGGALEVLASERPAPTGLALAPDAIYWLEDSSDIDGGLGAVVRLSRDGGVPEVLATEPGAPGRLVLSGDALVWTNLGGVGIAAHLLRLDLR
jgi:hypothetical protein